MFKLYTRPSGKSRISGCFVSVPKFQAGCAGQTYFQNLRIFPKRNNHIHHKSGNAMFAERNDGFFGKRPFRRNKEE